MASVKSLIKSKSFFIYSFLIYIFLVFVMLIFSWKFVELKAYNHMVKTYSAQKVAPKDTVLIVIDDKAVAKHRWPWKRELYGEIFEYLHDYAEPELIGFDAVLASTDAENPDSDEKLYKAIKPMENLTVGFSPLYPNFENKQQGEIYLNNFAKRFALDISDDSSYFVDTFYKSINLMPVNYFNSIHHVGTVNVVRDGDGCLRQTIFLSKVGENYYPSLALSMFIQKHKIKNISFKDENIVLDDINLTIPTSQSGMGLRSYMKFYPILKDSEYSHIKYSAGDILESLEQLKQGKTPIINPEVFKGKVVFVGANAKATALGLEDAMQTPMMSRHPGVDIVATTFDNLNNNEFIRLSSSMQDLGIIFILGFITYVLIYRFAFLKSLTLICLLGILYYMFAVFCYKNNYAINVITPLAIQLVTMVFAYSYRFILEGRNKEKIKNAMGKYLSQDVMKDVVKNIDDIKLGGKRANVTVLFADIRGFTSMSEKMSAEEVSVILNEYFSEIEPIITRHNGVINKFIGDAVMAIFGEPIPDSNHAQNSVRCACEMLEKVKELQVKWLSEGKPKIDIGVGINTGEAFVGNIGSEKRLEYTVIGDTVNLASRIESYNKVYKTHFLISATTFDKVSDIVETVKISDVQIRGKEKHMDLYEVLRLI